MNRNWLIFERADCYKLSAVVAHESPVNAVSLPGVRADHYDIPWNAADIAMPMPIMMHKRMANSAHVDSWLFLLLFFISFFP